MKTSFRWILVALVIAGAGTVPAFAADAPAEPADPAEPVELTETEAAPATEVQEAAPTLTLAEWTEPLFAQGGVEQCGVRVCGPGFECCNASCGICVEAGMGCIQIACEHPNGGAGPN